MTESYDPSSPSVRNAVERSLEDLPRKPRDAAAVAALQLYATLLDDAVDRMKDAAEDDETRDFGRMVNVISKVGPRFERMIDLLGMAPGSRPQAPPAGAQTGGDPRSAALDALRDTPSRVDTTAFVDPAVEDPDA